MINFSSMSLDKIWKCFFPLQDRKLVISLHLTLSKNVFFLLLCLCTGSVRNGKLKSPTIMFSEISICAFCLCFCMCLSVRTSEKKRLNESHTSIHSVELLMVLQCPFCFDSYIYMFKPHSLFFLPPTPQHTFNTHF